jgi:molecular chaperone GrpE
MKKEKNNPKENKKEEIDVVAKEFQSMLMDLENKNKELFAGWQRTEADFINYKKKETERLGELSAHLKERMFEDLLPIMDNFSLAERMIPEEKKSDNNIKGLLMIKKQLDEFIRSIGIEEIDSLGQQFDPEYDEAVEEVEGIEGESGTVIEEVQKGYLLNGKVLRPSKVKIVK